MAMQNAEIFMILSNMSVMVQESTAMHTIMSHEYFQMFTVTVFYNVYCQPCAIRSLMSNDRSTIKTFNFIKRI